MGRELNPSTRLSLSLETLSPARGISREAGGAGRMVRRFAPVVSKRTIKQRQRAEVATGLKRGKKYVDALRENLPAVSGNRVIP